MSCFLLSGLQGICSDGGRNSLSVGTKDLLGLWLLLPCSLNPGDQTLVVLGNYLRRNGIELDEYCGAQPEAQQVSDSGWKEIITDTDVDRRDNTGRAWGHFAQFPQWGRCAKLVVEDLQKSYIEQIKS